MSTPILSINSLSKRYGKIMAVDNLTLDIYKGNVFGILGPNGSGKTTTLGIILSVIRQNSGQYSWFGNVPSKYDRKRIGAIIEVPLFYPYLTAVQNLKIYADIRGVTYDKIDNVLGIVNLESRKDSRYKTYSLGMKQRLAIAAALLGDPEILILDEPTNGLDPQGIAEIRNLIIRISQEGITIILASHLLDEVQKICTHVVVLDNGQNIYTGKVEDVLNESATIEVGSADNSTLAQALKEIPAVKNYIKEGNKFVASVEDGFTSQDLNKILFDKGLVVSHLALKKKSLERHFLELLESHDKTS